MYSSLVNGINNKSKMAEIISLEFVWNMQKCIIVICYACQVLLYFSGFKIKVLFYVHVNPCRNRISGGIRHF